MKMSKYEKSERFFEVSRRYLAGGVGSSGRLTPELCPLSFKSGKGSRIYDVDDNEYIDYVLAWGPLILGHSPPAVVEAVKKQLDSGTIFGSATTEEADLARMVCECLPSVDLVRFTNSGSEAVHMALRLSKAYTGKSKIVKFEGAYHGWFDNILISTHPDSLKIAGLENSPNPIRMQPGIPNSVLQDILIVPWNRLDILEKVIQRHAHEIAAVIVEPVMVNNGVIPPREGFLEGLREVTKRNDIVLIFDEILTGFRMGLGGAQEYYGVMPDLTVFGKGMGGGYPMAGFGGISNIMDLIAEGKVGHFGTYNSNSLCVTATLATLKELRKDQGAVFKRMTKMGEKLMEGIKRIFLDNELPVVLQGPGTFFSLLFTDKPVVSYRDTFRVNSALYSQFWMKMLDQGIRVWTSARSIWYLSSAHNDDDIGITIEAIRKVVKDLKV
jgi:glutamate-1-semialdehyde 2,1-aminomutase